MGKRVIARARGKGSPRYRAPSHRYLGRVQYFSASGVVGVIKDILHDPGRSAPVMVVSSDREKILQIAPEGVAVGQKIKYDEDIAVGNVVELGKIPEGTRVCGIETTPGSGPKLCRSSGSFATVVGRSRDRVSVQLSSGKVRDFNAKCRATIGVPAGSGRVEKPWVKAGKRWHAMLARGKLYPRTKGVVMSPVDHPYGGKSHRPRPSRIVSRHAPPGAKIGSISPKQVGIKKKK